MSAPDLDSARAARINELCHLITTCEERAARVWLCNDLKREIDLLNSDRLARLNEALSLAMN